MGATDRFTDLRLFVLPPVPHSRRRRLWYNLAPWLCLELICLFLDPLPYSRSR